LRMHGVQCKMTWSRKRTPGRYLAHRTGIQKRGSHDEHDNRALQN
jgi:hypothetical protein